MPERPVPVIQEDYTLMPLCANGCGTDFSEFFGWYIEHNEGWDNDMVDNTYRSGLCSVDCLIEFAWKIREKTPKLSKSKTETCE